jgi:hypothetical protein
MAGPCQKKCESDDLSKCLKCVSYNNGQCSKTVSYNSYYDCSKCSNGIVTQIAKPCYRCTERAVTINKASGSIHKAPGNPWTKAVLHVPIPCEDCTDKNGQEVWVNRCQANEECEASTDRCLPKCNPNCDPLCEECRCANTRCTSKKCFPTCSGTNRACLSIEGCVCLLVPYSVNTFAIPPKTNCPKANPDVKTILGPRNPFTNQQEILGCECYCDLDPKLCFEIGKKFSAGSCQCLSLCGTDENPDYDCDSAACEECIEKNGSFGCHSKCTANQRCEEGSCYDIGSALSINSFIP